MVTMEMALPEEQTKPRAYLRNTVMREKIAMGCIQCVGVLLKRNGGGVLFLGSNIQYSRSDLWGKTA